MSCDKIVGVKNIVLTFTDCETGETIGPISHKQANEDLPTWKTCEWENEAMTNGYSKRTASNAGAEFSVIRDLRVPLAWYQGCASLAVQIEYTNGLVYTGVDGTIAGAEKSDTHEVALDVTFQTVDELLPAGSLAA